MEKGYFVPCFPLGEKELMMTIILCPVFIDG